MEGTTDAYRRSLKLTVSDILSSDQHNHELNGLPATGQTQYHRSSSLSSDPYWQQKRDSRKSSLLQKNLTSLAENDMVPSTGMTRSGVQSATYISAIRASGWAEPSKGETRHASASRLDPDLNIQHSIETLIGPSQYDDGGYIQTDEYQGTESSTQHQPRQGSTVRFALLEEEAPGRVADGANPSEVRSHHYVHRLFSSLTSPPCLTTSRKHMWKPISHGLCKDTAPSFDQYTSELPGS